MFALLGVINNFPRKQTIFCKILRKTMLRQVKNWLREKITDILICMITKINFCKDNMLAQKLREVANDYDTRPRENP